MSIFAKPVSQIDAADLQELISERAVENVVLEFKSQTPNKDETLKKLSAFANTIGGYVVTGAAANSEDGRITGLPGVQPEPNYKQTVVQWCSQGVTPPIQIEVSDPVPAPAGDGKVCYVIHVPESEVAPHFINGRKGVYVRTNEFSSRFDAQFATENEIRQLIDRRKVVYERRSTLILRARRRFETLAKTRIVEPGTNAKGLGCTFDLTFIPRFPTRRLCDQATILKLVKTESLSWRGVGFPRTGEGSISQHESAIVLRPGSTFSILEANVWGLVFYGAEIERELDGHVGIHLYQFLGHLLVFIHHAANLLPLIGYAGPLLVEMKLDGILGMPWLYAPQGFLQIGPASKLDDEAIFSIAAESDTLAGRPDLIAMNLMQLVFFATGWPSLAESSDRLEDCVKAGYDYNSWGKQSKLKT